MHKSGGKKLVMLQWALPLEAHEIVVADKDVQCSGCAVV